MHHSFLIHSSADGHLGCSHVLAIINSAAMNIGVHVEHVMRNAGPEEAQTGIKIARRNINNLRYADDTTLMAENEEEQKSLLMRVKKESAKAGLNSMSKKLQSWHLVPSLHGK